MKAIQLEFDFGFDAQTKSEIAQNPKQKKQKPAPKPTTAADYKPGTDNHIIKVYEAEFLAGDKEALVRMYKAICNLAKKYIYSEKEKNGFYLRKEEIREKCNDVGLYILQRYLEDKDFRLQMPSGYVWRRVMRALYYQNWTDLHVDFTDKL